MPWKETEKYTSGPVRVAVLGAGHAGRGLASYLSIHGLDVALYNRTFENVKGISDRGGIKAHGLVEGFAHISRVTDNMKEAIDGRDILVVSVPAQAHTFFARYHGPPP